MKSKTTILLTAVVFGAAGVAQADLITYSLNDVQVDGLAISGTFTFDTSANDALTTWDISIPADPRLNLPAETFQTGDYHVAEIGSSGLIVLQPASEGPQLTLNFESPFSYSATSPLAYDGIDTNDYFATGCNYSNLAFPGGPCNDSYSVQTTSVSTIMSGFPPTFSFVPLFSSVGSQVTGGGAEFVSSVPDPGAATPEPGTAVTFLAGLALLAAGSLRRRQM